MGIAEIVSRTPTFAEISDKALKALVSSARLRSFKRGDYLWHCGDSPEYLTIIRTGLIKVVKHAAQGRSSICGLFGAPDTVGDAAVMRGISYPADAMVTTESASVVEVGRNEFLATVEREPKLALSCARAVQSKVVALHAKIDVLAAGSVDARLAQLLISLYDRFGDELEDESQLIPIVLSRRELSQLISTTLETVIRIMTRWEREGIVSTTSSGFIIKQREVVNQIIVKGPAFRIQGN
jgi:CRP/FNR family transcriptional regulator